MKYFSLLLFVVFAGFVYNESVQYPHGIVGLTQLNGEGCVCHNITSSPLVNVVIKGPDSLAQGASAEYTVFVTGGTAHSAGFNIAAKTGLLSVSDTSARKIDVELTHTSPKVFSNDTVRWSFLYTAPSSVNTDTLYSVALSADGNGVPSAQDLWNFGNSFPVRIVAAIPVELTSFNASVTSSGILVKWITASELNNSGFVLERKINDEVMWKSVQFFKGIGNTTQETIYEYTDAIQVHGTIHYRLRQNDFNGSYKYYGVISVNESNIPLGYLVASVYPNPFNPETTLEFSVPDQGEMEIQVYNVHGEFVQSLFKGSVSSGINKLSWNASHFAAGLYFINLNFSSVNKSNLSKTIKTVLLK